MAKYAIDLSGGDDDELKYVPHPHTAQRQNGEWVETIDTDTGKVISRARASSNMINNIVHQTPKKTPPGERTTPGAEGTPPVRSGGRTTSSERKTSSGNGGTRKQPPKSDPPVLRPGADPTDPKVQKLMMDNGYVWNEQLGDWVLDAEGEAIGDIDKVNKKTRERLLGHSPMQTIDMNDDKYWEGRKGYGKSLLKGGAAKLKVNNSGEDVFAPGTPISHDENGNIRLSRAHRNYFGGDGYFGLSKDGLDHYNSEKARIAQYYRGELKDALGRDLRERNMLVYGPGHKLNIVYNKKDVYDGNQSTDRLRRNSKVANHEGNTFETNGVETDKYGEAVDNKSEAYGGNINRKKTIYRLDI